MAKIKRVKADKVTINGVEVQYYIQDGKVVDESGNPAPPGIAAAIMAGMTLESPPEPPPKKPAPPPPPPEPEEAASPQRKASKKATLSDLNEKISNDKSKDNDKQPGRLRRALGGVGRAVGGIAAATGGVALGGTLEALGLERLVPAAALASAFSFGGGSKKGGGSSSGGNSLGGSSGDLKGVLQNIQTIDSSILEAMTQNNDLLKTIVEAMDEARFRDIEKRREEGALKNKAGGGIGAKGGTTPGWLKWLEPIALGLAAALGGILGVLKGYLRPLTEFSKFLGRQIMRLYRAFTQVVTDAIKIFKSFFSGEGIAGRIGKVFRTIVEAVKDFLKPVGRIGGFLSEIFSEAVGLFEKIIAPFKVAFTWIGELFKGASRFGAIIGDLAGMFGKVAKVFAFALKWMEPIGWVVLIVQTLYDTIVGAIDGYKKGGIVGAIGGAIKGLFDSLIAAPLDMIKDFVSWILNLFGWENASKALDSFSFAKLFDDFIDGIGSSITNIVNMVWDFFKSIPGKFVNFVSSFIPDFLKNAWKKMFGGSTEQVATPKASPPPSAQDNATTLAAAGIDTSSQPDVSAKTPAVPSASGGSKEELSNKLEALHNNGSISDGLYNLGKTSLAKGRLSIVEKIVSTAENKGANISVTADQNGVSATQNASAATFTQQSAAAAVNNSTTTPPVNIINNNVSGGGGGAGKSGSPPRSAGGVTTSPQQSHIDRALYGDLYGAGIP
jgi:hypothetical protein